MMSRRVFAIGLKGWVELREAATPPKLKESTITKEFPDRVRTLYDVDIDRHRRVIIPQKFTIKVRDYEGGKFLESIPAFRFTRLTMIALRLGGMVELMPKQVELLLGKEPE